MVKLAVEIREQAERMNAYLLSGLGPCTSRSGINSGGANLGTVGSSDRMEYMVIYDKGTTGPLRAYRIAGRKESVVGA